jgi:RNA polymerase sigma-70 factor, ECF subfamily
MRRSSLDLVEIYEAHAPTVMRFLLARVGSAFDAEDLCQETFQLFFKKAEEGTFDGSRPARPFLLGIAKNLALKRLGKIGREQPFEEEHFGEENAVDPEANERARWAQELYATFEEPERQVATGYFVEGLSQQSLGDELGMSRDQVYRTIVRVRKKALAFFKERGWWDGT